MRKPRKQSSSSPILQHQPLTVLPVAPQYTSTIKNTMVSVVPDSDEVFARLLQEAEDRRARVHDVDFALAAKLNKQWNGGMELRASPSPPSNGTFLLSASEAGASSSSSPLPDESWLLEDQCVRDAELARCLADTTDGECQLLLDSAPWAQEQEQRGRSEGEPEPEAGSHQNDVSLEASFAGLTMAEKESFCPFCHGECSFLPQWRNGAPFCHSACSSAEGAKTRTSSSAHGPSVLFVRRSADSKLPGTRCAFCLEEDLPTAQFPTCEHAGCEPCVRRIFTTALADGTLSLPVSCCSKPLSDALARRVLDSNEYLQLLDRTEEAAARFKMYCPRAGCSAFLNLDRVLLVQQFGELGGQGAAERTVGASSSGDSREHLGGESTSSPVVEDLRTHAEVFPPNTTLPCPSCGDLLCLHCMSAAHPEFSCAQNQVRRDGANELAQEAERQGWRCCSRCRTFVELRQGCNHMTCFCRNEFCYTCGAIWKTCECVLFTEEMLMREEQRRVEVQVENLGRDLRIEERRVIHFELQQDNVENRECRHHVEGWYWRTYSRRLTCGGNRRECDNCGDEVGRKCYNCRGCGIKVCRHCRHHRRITC